MKIDINDKLLDPIYKGLCAVIAEQPLATQIQITEFQHILLTYFFKKDQSAAAEEEIEATAADEEIEAAAEDVEEEEGAEEDVAEV